MIVLGIISLLIIPFSGCIGSDNNNENDNEYSKGYIIVNFKEGINYTEAINIIEKYNLTIFSFTYDEETNIGEGIIKVPEEKEQYYINLLKQDPNIIETDFQRKG